MLRQGPAVCIAAEIENQSQNEVFPVLASLKSFLSLSSLWERFTKGQKELKGYKSMHPPAPISEII